MARGARFPERGVHDDKPTPKTLLEIIVERLGFVDVCTEGSNFFTSLPERAYCNPPFSRKDRFVYWACSEHCKGKTIILLVPADFSTNWFKHAYFDCKASVVILAGRFHGSYARYPTMLLVFNGRGEVVITRLYELEDVLRRLVG